MTGGQTNIAIGYQALQTANVSSGEQNNVAIGYLAGNDVTTGTLNTLIGGNAGDVIDTGAENVALGYNALGADVKGNASIAIGSKALQAQSFSGATDVYNVAVGHNAGKTVSTGIKNTIIGGLAGDVLTDADFNVAVGYGALSEDHKGSRSTAIGAFTLEAQEFANSTNSFNTAVGYNAGALVTTGIQNTFVGNEAGDGIVTGSRNTAFGNRALSGAVDDGNNNTCIGMDAGTVTTGNNNTFVGAYNGSTGGCGSLVTSGSNNTILGSYNGNQSGVDIRTSNNNIVLSDGDGNVQMHFTGDGNANLYNSVNNAYSFQILNSATGTQPYGMRIYYTDIARDDANGAFIECTDSGALRFKVFNDGDVQNHDNSYAGLSDVKLKEQIADASSQWDDIKALTVRKYKMKTDVATGDSDAHWRLGVVAQEVETAGMNGLVKDSPDFDKDNNDLGTTTKAVKYSILYMKAVKALQEAMTRIETLESKVATLENGE